MTWVSIADDREKYKAYLCSREWALLRKAVRARCGGKCERCKVNDMECVHHLTYARKYDERIDDLAGWCNACHEFIHAKGEYDPLMDAPIVIPFCGRMVKTFYLAGKISGTSWRGDIVRDWGEQNHSDTYDNAVCLQDQGVWLRTKSACSVLGRPLDFTGPWWSDAAQICSGHASASSSLWPHGQDQVTYYERDGEVVYSGDSDGSEVAVGALSEDRQRRVMRQVAGCVASAINSSDLVFAWIDSLDCYGTILEIGMAKALGKAVAVAVHYDVPADELWLVLEGTYKVEASSAKDGWNEFWRIVAKGVA
jgi:hypothetical protein